MGKKNNDILKTGAKALLVLAFVFACAFSVAPAYQDAVQTDSISPVQTAFDVQVATQNDLKIGQKLIPLGRTTGIKMYSEGPVIVGLSPVGNDQVSPAQKAGLSEGDIILAINGKQIASNEALISYLAEIKNSDLTITVKHQNEKQDFKVTAVYDESMGRYLIGAWVRDSMAGIGTITFVDPKTGFFGALGHSITDADTGFLVPFHKGAVMESSIVSIKKGESGTPGELVGGFRLTENQGLLYGNTIGGISGKLYEDTLYKGMKAMEIAQKSEIKVGPAYILANVEGNTVQQYSIEIVKIYKTSGEETRDMMIRVTDPALIEKTGGIVQGMSGSPIIQNGKLIGAVTHVLVNEPVSGYGISIENMIKYLTTVGALSNNV